MELHATINKYGLLKIVDNKNAQLKDIKNVPLNDVTKLVLSRLRMSPSVATDFSPIENLTNLTSLVLGDVDKTDISAIGNLTKLTSLKLADVSGTNLSPIGNLTNLTSLHIKTLRGVTDISWIGKLSSLTSLVIDYVDKTNLSPIGNLTNLTSLHIKTLPGATDISWIGNLTKLTSLKFGDAIGTNLSPIRNLTNLTSLHLKTLRGEPLAYVEGRWVIPIANDNTVAGVTDISWIGQLSGLTALAIDHVAEADISAIGSLPNLTSLVLGDVDKTDISAIGNLTKLTSLKFGDVSGTNLSPIGNLTKLTSLKFGDVSGTNLSPIGNLTNLTSLHLKTLRGVTDISWIGKLSSLTSLVIDYVDKTDISPIGSLPNLTSLDIGAGDEIDISAIGNLPNLTSLVIDYFAKIDISAIGNLTKLTSLKFHGQDLSMDEGGILDISAIGNLTALEDLKIWAPWEVEDFSCIARLSNLKSLSIDFDCRLDLVNFSYMGNLPNLNSLELNIYEEGHLDIELEVDAPKIASINWASLNGMTYWDDYEEFLDLISDDSDDNALLDCFDCGGTTFKGTCSASYNALNWETRSASIEVPRYSNVEGLQGLWETMRESELSLKDFYADDFLSSYCFPEISSLDIKCIKCQARLDLSPKIFQSYKTTISNEADKIWGSLNISEGALEKENQEKNTDETTTACPCCFGAIELFGESLWVEHESGHAACDISFTDATVATLGNHAITPDATNPSTGIGDNKPAKLGFRVGLKCADNQCFEYKGIDSEDAFLVPLIKVATYRATFLASNGQPYLDSYKSLLQGLAITADNAEHYLNRIKFCGDNFLLAAELEDDAQSLMKKTIKEMSFRD
jgi:internalin A